MDALRLLRVQKSVFFTSKWCFLVHVVDIIEKFGCPGVGQFLFALFFSFKIASSESTKSMESGHRTWKRMTRNGRKRDTSRTFVEKFNWQSRRCRRSEVMQLESPSTSASSCHLCFFSHSQFSHLDCCYLHYPSSVFRSAIPTRLRSGFPSCF